MKETGLACPKKQRRRQCLVNGNYTHSSYLALAAVGSHCLDSLLSLHKAMFTWSRKKRGGAAHVHGPALCVTLPQALEPYNFQLRICTCMFGGVNPESTFKTQLYVRVVFVLFLNLDIWCHNSVQSGAGLASVGQLLYVNDTFIQNTNPKNNKNPCAEVQAVDKCARKKETSEYKNNIEM